MERGKIAVGNLRIRARASTPMKAVAAQIAEQVQHGKLLVAGDRLNEAEQLYLELLSDFPRERLPNLYLAKIYMRQRRWREAIRPLRAALAAKPSDVKARATLARALFKDGEYQKAISHSRDALTIDPKDAATWFILGRSLHKMGEYAEAVDALRAAAELKPSDAIVRLQLVDALLHSGRRLAAISELVAAVRNAETWSQRKRVFEKIVVVLYSKFVISKLRSVVLRPLAILRSWALPATTWLIATLRCRHACTPFATVSVIARDFRTNELSKIGSANLLLPLSDPMFINWRKTFFSDIAADVDFSFFDLHSFRLRDQLLKCVLLYASYLKVTGLIKEAGQIYAALAKSKRSRDAAFGHIGLGDISHLAELWDRQIGELDDRGLTLFPNFGGLRTFLNDHLKWDVPEGGFDTAEGHYRTAVRLAPSLPFAWYQIARVNADQQEFRRAVRYLSAGLKTGSPLSGPTKHMLAMELSRLRYLAGLSGWQGSDPDCPIVERSAGRLRALETRNAPSVREGGCASETLPMQYMVHYGDHDTEVTKTAHFPALGIQTNASGAVPTLIGAPFISDEGYVSRGATIFPTFPGGREIFSPMFLGQAGTRELYIEKAEGELRDIAVLPGFGANYFHFLFDSLGAGVMLPGQFADRDLLFFCNRIRPYHLELFGMLGIDEGRVHAISARHGTALSVRDAVVPDYPNQGGVVHPAVARRLRKRLFDSNFEPRKRKRIYLVRSGSRSFAAADRIAVHKLMASHGFEIIDPGSLTVAEQIKLTRDAETIAVDGGAAASNLLFAPSGASVIIIAPAAGYTDCFTPLCSEFGLHLNVALVPARVRPKYVNTWSSYDLQLDVGTIGRAIEAAIRRSE
jgi:tetratricopeptide (TPR) repeat protein